MHILWQRWSTPGQKGQRILWWCPQNPPVWCSMTWLVKVFPVKPSNQSQVFYYISSCYWKKQVLKNANACISHRAEHCTDVKLRQAVCYCVYLHISWTSLILWIKVTSQDPSVYAHIWLPSVELLLSLPSLQVNMWWWQCTSTWEGKWATSWFRHTSLA